MPEAEAARPLGPRPSSRGGAEIYGVGQQDDTRRIDNETPSQHRRAGQNDSGCQRTPIREGKGGRAGGGSKKSTKTNARRPGTAPWCSRPCSWHPPQIDFVHSRGMFLPSEKGRTTQHPEHAAEEIQAVSEARSNRCREADLINTWPGSKAANQAQAGARSVGWRQARPLSRPSPQQEARGPGKICSKGVVEASHGPR